MELPIKDGDLWLTAVLEHVRDAVIGVDRAGAVVWMNPAAERLTGRQAIQVVGRQVGEIFNAMEKEPRHTLGASVQTVLNSGTAAYEPGLALHRAGDDSVRVDYTVSPVFQDAECRGAVIVLSGPGSDAAGQPETDPASADAREPDRTRRVLVMDDDDVVRNLTVQKLIRLGYESEGASSGEEAVSRFKAAKDSGAPFDAVVLDLIVRGGMGGKETVEMLRQVDPGVKAILTSGNAMDPVLTNFWEYGFFGVIRKPFVIKELDVAIRQALESE